MMDIIMDKTELANMLEKAEMKGKYYDGNKSKNSSLTNYAYCFVEQGILFIYNADLTTACGFRSEVETSDEGTKSFILDIEKTKAYLKPFTDEVILNIGDYLTISDDSETAKLPLVTEHPAHDMVRLISRRFLKVVDSIKDYTDEMEDGESVDPPIITFGKTEYDCHLEIPEGILTEAMKACDVVDLARYKIDVNESEVLISSERSITDSFVYDVDCGISMSINTEATMEFTGDILKFINGTKNIHMLVKDDSPLLLITPNSLLVKAPYLVR